MDEVQMNRLLMQKVGRKFYGHDTLNTSTAATAYVQCDSSTSGAKEVVADDVESPTANQIKISDVTPGYAPAVGDYVVSKQVHGATVDIGARFGNASDDGIAVIEINM